MEPKAKDRTSSKTMIGLPYIVKELQVEKKHSPIGNVKHIATFCDIAGHEYFEFKFHTRTHLHDIIRLIFKDDETFNLFMLTIFDSKTMNFW